MKVFRFEVMVLLLILAIASIGSAAGYYRAYGPGINLNQAPAIPGGVPTLDKLRARHVQYGGEKRFSNALWATYYNVPEFRSTVDQAVFDDGTPVPTATFMEVASKALDQGVMKLDLPTAYHRHGDKSLLVSSSGGPSYWRQWDFRNGHQDQGAYWAVGMRVFNVYLDVAVLKICGNIEILPPTVHAPRHPCPRGPPVRTCPPEVPLDSEGPGSTAQYEFSRTGPGGTTGTWLQPTVAGIPTYVPTVPKAPAPPPAQAHTGHARSNTATITVGGQTISLNVANSVSSSAASAAVGGGTAASASNGSSAGGASGTITTAPVTVTFPGS